MYYVVVEVACWRCTIVVYMCEVDVAQERQHQALLEDVETFRASSLKRTNTREKIVLPNAQGHYTAPSQPSLHFYAASLTYLHDFFLYITWILLKHVVWYMYCYDCFHYEALYFKFFYTLIYFTWTFDLIGMNTEYIDVFIPLRFTE